MKILISGDGAMGQSVFETAKQMQIEVIGQVGQNLSGSLNSAFCVSDLPNCVVDFSCCELLADTVEFCKHNSIPLVTGTTNLNQKTQKRIQELALHVAVCQSSNFSVGVLILKRLLDVALGGLKDFDFDIEFTEKHHSKKSDSPSGTAKDLLAKIVSAKKDARLVFDRRDGAVRDKNDVGVSCVRGGSVVGIHEIEFFGEGESVLLRHTAQNKSIFASGALSVAKKLCLLPKGFYGFEYFVKENWQNGTN